MPASKQTQTAEQGASSERTLRRGVWAAAIAGSWVLVCIGAVTIGAAQWVRRTFGVISVDQLLSNLNGGGGEGAGGEALVTDAVVAILVLPIVYTLALAVLFEVLRRMLRTRGWFSGMRKRVFRGVVVGLVVVVPVSGVTLFGQSVGFDEYVQASIREQTLGTTIADYYVSPKLSSSSGSGGTNGANGAASTALSAGARSAGALGAGASQSASAGGDTNLVLIYLESVEDVFTDDTLFEKNMLAPVEQATSGWDSLKLQQYEGGGWTMAGIVGTQCGIPLRTATAGAETGDLNNLGSGGQSLAQYLPGANCLGDVLKDAGYRNVYLGGADASFAGKGTFLKDHGYDEIQDLNVWRGQGETEIRDDWGLSDRRLFEHAKDTVTQLHEGDQPFNLTMLSLDTHEGPRVYDYCDVTTKAVMTSITFCSMEQVSGFIDYMETRGYLKDTTVVVMGDHRKTVVEGGSFWNELKDREHRTVFNRVWTPGGVEFARNEVDQLSMYPTMLELVGVNVKEHRAGIGVSALADENDVSPGSILDLDSDEYRDVVKSRSVDFYAEIWADDPQAVAAG